MCRNFRYVDPQNKGYCDFKEFNSKLRAGMLVLDQEGYQIVVPSTQPSVNQNESLKAFLPELNKQIKQLERKNLPPPNPRRATRFSATPAHKNTFLNVEAAPGSGMYHSSQERFRKGREDFIREEKEKKDKLYEGKLDRIRQHQKQIHEKIHREMDQIDSR